MMIAPSPSILFSSDAAVREAAGDRPLPLEAGHAWLVVEGRIDVFATRVDQGVPAGRRTHLFRVEAGELLLGVEPGAGGTVLLAVGNPGTRVAEVAPAELHGLAASPQRHAMLAALLRTWVERLFDGVAANAPLPGAQVAEAGETVEVPAGEQACPAAHGAWVEQLTGESRFLGCGAGTLMPGDIFPVPRGSWLEGAHGAACRVRFLPAEYLFSGEVDDGRARLWSGLERLHAAVMDRVEARLAAADAARYSRAAARAAASRASLHGALARMAAPLEVAPGPERRTACPAAPASEEEALHGAFRRVARAQGMKLEARPPVHAARRRRDPVDALARAHRVRARRVALRHGWWSYDNGPLLGRRAETLEPVALVPRPEGGYLLHCPRAPLPVPVGEVEAAGLAPFAHTLYRPLHAGPVRFRDLIRFAAHGCRGDLVRLLQVALASALLGLVTPLAVGTLFGTVIPGAERGQLVQLVCVLLAAAVATSAFNLVRGMALLRIEARVGTAVQTAVWDRLLSLPLRFFRGYAAGDLAMRAMRIEEIRRVLSGAVLSGLLSGLFSTSSFALLFYFDAGLALLAVGMVGTALAATVGVSWLQLRGQRAILELQSKASGTVLQLLNGIAKLRLAGAEVQAFGKWARLFSDQREQQLRVRTLGIVLTLVHAVFPPLCTLAIFAAASARVGGAGALGTGEFLAFTSAFAICLSAALSAGAAGIGVLSALPLYEQVRPILDAEPEVHAGKHDPGELTGALEVQHATFRYDAAGPAVLRDVSFRVRAGEFVAFVGPSGSGKSTLLRLLLGFEHPETGSVSFDDQELSALDMQAVREQVGVVLQDGKPLAGDLYTNIVGASSATVDDAWEALRLAGLDEYVKSLPMGLHTVVSEGAGTFSGGQRQRLMIARALVNRPRILFLDEATSALDNRTQAVVSEGLAALQATRVVIAHRLSTVMHADRICVMNGGRIVESGTFDELMARGGLFHDMARRQLA